MRVTRRLALSALPGLLAAPRARAQGTWPDRPVRVIVPSAPGGPTDLATRLIGERLLQETRQSIVVDNRAGAGGMIGLRMGARAAPDGYTFTMGNPGPVAVVPHIEPDVGYDILTDFVAVSMVMTVPITLVVRPELPVRTVAELVAYMRANPGRVAFGTSGPGQSPHMATELLLKMTGLEAVISPYRGAPPAVNDLLAGSIQAMFDTTTSRPAIDAGRLRPLAIGSPRRSALMPDVPTMAEAGFPGFEISSWYVLLAPAHTPVEIVQAMNGVVGRCLNEPSVRARLAAVNAEAIPSTPAEAAAFVRYELANWGTIVRSIGAARAG